MLATLAMFCCMSVPADTSRTSSSPAPAVQSKSSEDASVAAETTEAKENKPDAPAPKAMEESETAAVSPSPAPAPIFNAPVRPATTDAYETPRQRVAWYALVAAGHASAAFDAWTTRRAISGGYGVEGDPFQRPFAHSNAIYASTQVSPLVMDYVGHRLMRSRYPLLRQFWWLPQAANASFSFGAAVHNYHVVH
jgi:hypothetical protein